MLDYSQPESCTTDYRMPPGYQATSGEGITPTPGLHFLRSPPGPTSAQVDSEEENTETESHVEVYQAETWFRWSERHQRQFRHQLGEQDLGSYSLNVIGGYQPQASMTT